MTVAELIRELAAMPQDATVEVAYEATSRDQIEVNLEQGVVLIEVIDLQHRAALEAIEREAT